MSPHGERDAYVRGIGQSDVRRRLMRSELSLTLEACLAAVADAGLTLDETSTAWPPIRARWPSSRGSPAPAHRWSRRLCGSA